MSPSPLTFKPVPLFGGALTANMPAHFADVSDLRQVPDNQEVYLATDGFTSVTVDLCERVPSPPPLSPSAAACASSPSSSSSSSAHHNTTTPQSTDAGGADNPNHYALTYHFFDIVAAEDTKRIHSTRHNIRLPHFPASTPVSSLLARTAPPPPPPANVEEEEEEEEGGRRERGRNEASWVGVIMTLVRLVQAETDMLVVVNVPFVPEEAGEEEEVVVDFERGVYGRAVEEGRAIMEGVLGSLRVVDWGLFGDDGGNGEGRSG